MAETVRGRCPVCGRRLVITATGTIPYHWDGLFIDCPGEGQAPAPEPDVP